MSNIDNSTYKQIKKSRKLSEEGRYDKGRYGHWKHYRNMRILVAAILLLAIAASVVLSLAVFHTKKTVFIVIACLLAIPFARNITDIIMVLKAKSLERSVYEKMEAVSQEAGVRLLYDIMITETDGAVYIPCMLIASNNIIAFTPDYSDTKAREKIKTYISGANTAAGLNFRIFVTEREDTFIKEIKKVNIHEGIPSEDDIRMKQTILSMGI